MPALVGRDVVPVVIALLDVGGGNRASHPVSWWCRGCREALIMVIDGSSGCIDWGTPDSEHGDDPEWADFGCSFGADEDGSPGHMPAVDLPGVRAYWTRNEVKR